MASWSFRYVSQPSVLKNYLLVPFGFCTSAILILLISLLVTSSERRNYFSFFFGDGSFRNYLTLKTWHFNFSASALAGVPVSVFQMIAPNFSSASAFPRHINQKRIEAITLINLVFTKKSSTYKQAGVLNCKSCKYAANTLSSLTHSFFYRLRGN